MYGLKPLSLPAAPAHLLAPEALSLSPSPSPSFPLRSTHDTVTLLDPHSPSEVHLVLRGPPPSHDKAPISSEGSVWTASTPTSPSDTMVIKFVESEDIELDAHLLHSLYCTPAAGIIQGKLWMSADTRLPVMASETCRDGDLGRADLRALSLDDFVRLMMEPLAGLATLHTLHHAALFDVAPGNIFLDLGKELGRRAVLGDLTTARRVETDGSCLRGDIPIEMDDFVPELSTPGSSYDTVNAFALDVYAFGVTVEELARKLGMYSPRLAHVVDALCNADPTARPSAKQALTMFGMLTTTMEPLSHRFQQALVSAAHPSAPHPSFSHGG